MVSGPNLNETSIVSGGYGGAAEGIIPTGSIKGNKSHNSTFTLNLYNVFGSYWVFESCVCQRWHNCCRVRLGPGIRFNPEYFDRRCGHAPKPGVCLRLQTRWKTSLYNRYPCSFLSLFISGQKSSRGKSVSQLLTTSIWPLFFRLWRIVAC